MFGTYGHIRDVIGTYYGQFDSCKVHVVHLLEALKGHNMEMLGTHGQVWDMLKTCYGHII